jgi:hypothetical protein
MSSEQFPIQVICVVVLQDEDLIALEWRRDESSHLWKGTVCTPGKWTRAHGLDAETREGAHQWVDAFLDGRATYGTTQEAIAATSPLEVPA